MYYFSYFTLWWQINDAFASDKDKEHGPADLKRVLIVGAGQAGEGLVRDLKRGNLSGHRIC